MIFDTHQFMKRMTEAGFTPTQAEALCDEQIKLINNNLATKQDIQELSLYIEKFKVDVELAMTKGVEKHIKWTLSALTFAVVFLWLLMHFS